MPFSRIGLLLTHTAACAAGAILVFGLSPRHSTAQGDATSHAASQSARLRLTRRTGEGVHRLAADYKRLIKESDDMELTVNERSQLLNRLEKEWQATDPDSYFLWEEDQLSWRSTSVPSALFASQHPDLIYRHALETGSFSLLLDLAEKNPAATLALAKAGGLLDDPDLVSAIFESGIAGDPDFAAHLDEVDDGELRSTALFFMGDTLARNGQASALASLWKQHPDMINPGLLGTYVVYFEENEDPYRAQLLPGEGWENSSHDPLSELKFIQQLQRTYLPGATREDFAAILDECVLFGDQDKDEVNAIADLANGQVTPAGLEALANRWLFVQNHDPSLAETAPDPAFRDATIKAMLEMDRLPFNPSNPDQAKDEIRQRLLSEISDPALRASLTAKYSSPPEGEIKEDPLSGQ